MPFGQVDRAKGALYPKLCTMLLDHKHELSDQGWCVFVLFFQPRLLLSFCFNFSFFCSPNKDILSNLGFVVMPVLIQYNCTSIPLKATFAKVDNSNFCFCFYFSCRLIFPKQSLLEKTIYIFCIHALFYGTNSYALNHLITFHIKNI